MIKSKFLDAHNFIGGLVALRERELSDKLVKVESTKFANGHSISESTYRLKDAPAIGVITRNVYRHVDQYLVEVFPPFGRLYDEHGESVKFFGLYEDLYSIDEEERREIEKRGYDGYFGF